METMNGRLFLQYFICTIPYKQPLVYFMYCACGIMEFPFLSCRSPSVSTASPHHIQWFALELLSPSSHAPAEEGEGAGSGEALRFVRDLVEFRLLLYRAHQLQHCQQHVAVSGCSITQIHVYACSLDITEQALYQQPIHNEK